MADNNDLSKSAADLRRPPNTDNSSDRVVSSTPGTRRNSITSAGIMADQPQDNARDPAGESARKPRARPVDYGAFVRGITITVGLYCCAY